MPTTSVILLIAMVACSTCISASDEAFETRYQTDSLRPLNMPPRFDNGYLAVYESKGLGIYAASGALRYRIANPPQGSIRSVAVHQDGTTATAIHFSFGNGAIWLYDPAGSHVRTVQSEDFVPSYVAFAPDGSVWTTGTQDRPPGSPVTDYSILRHFSREGAFLGAYLPRSSFRIPREPAEPSRRSQPCVLRTVESVCTSPAATRLIPCGLKPI